MQGTYDKIEAVMTRRTTRPRRRACSPTRRPAGDYKAMLRTAASRAR